MADQTQAPAPDAPDATASASARAALDPGALMRLGGLKVRAARVVEGVLAGLHRSPHKGSSVEFAEYKEYAPGDPIRHIDWKAYAKSDKYYLKQYEDETNLQAWLLLDASGSMDFAGAPATPTKLEYGRTLVASLAWLLLRQGDAPGLLCFDREPRAALPPSGRSTHLDDMLHLLEQLRPADRPTDLAAVLEQLAERLKRRSLVVVVSDMLDRNPRVGHLLHVLRSRRMDVVLFHLVDPAELALPFEGLTLFEGLEDDGQLLVDPDDIRAAYQQVFDEHLESVQRICRQAQIEYHRAVTSTPYDAPLLAMLRGRARLRLRGRAR